MCANYFIAVTAQQLADQFGIEAANLDKSELYPKRPAPAIVQSGRKRSLHMMQWNLVPFWAKEDNKLAPFNARGETVATSPMFREAFKGRRCLMLASGFYEWKGEKGSKVRYRFTLPDGEPFAFAGIWNEKDGEESCCLITTTPNKFMADYHNRMPVILDPRDYGTWLEPNAKVAELKSLITPWPAEMHAMEAPKAKA